MDISIRKLFLFLLFIVLILLGMHFFPNSLSWTIANRFNLNEEANIPTWYSTVLLFSVSLSSLFIYLFENKVVGRDHSWHLFWLGFGAAYCFLSLDETARFHEIIDAKTSIKWVLVYAPFAWIFFIICTIYFVVIRNDNKSLRNWVLGGMIIYALGGLVSELIDHLFYPLSPALQQVEFVLEEGPEMVGTIMVLMGCLQELRRLYGVMSAHEDINT